MSSVKAVDMTVGSPLKKMILFSFPLLLGNLFQQFYNTADSIIVGNFLGTKALAAVGAGFPFMTILFSFFMGLGMAATIMVSQAIGAKDPKQVDYVVNTIYKTSVIVFLPATLFGYFAAEPILELLNVPDDGTLVMATEYLQVVFLGMFATIGYNTNAGLFQGMGDSITSLKLLVLSAGLNVVLDLLFVGPLNMGVGGAAFATVLAQAISWILGLIILRKRFDYVSLNLLHLKFDRDIFKESMRLGIPTAIQSALFSVGSMVMYSLINSYGSNFMAGFHSANKIDMLVYMPIMSLSNGATTYTGQNIGAKNWDRVRQGVRSVLLITLVVALVTSGITYLFSENLLKMFDDDPEMIEAGLYYLNSVLPFYFTVAVLFSYNGLLRGVGQVNIPLIATFVSLILVRVPTAYYIAANYGKEYIYYSYIVGWGAGALIAMGFFYFGRWRKRLQLEMQGAEKSIQVAD